MASIIPLRPQGEPDDPVRAAARDWVMRVAEDPSAEAEGRAWRAADPAHAAAWAEVSGVWDLAPALAALDRADWRAEIDALTAAPPRRRWQAWGMAAAAALVAAIGLPQYLARPDLTAATRVAETRRLALADGSRVTLGGQTEVEITFEPQSRRVVLDHGQAFFEVAHDPSRPFTVVAGDAEIRVTGTKFDVRRNGDDVQVSVLEGRVEVRRHRILSVLRAQAKPERVLTAGLASALPADAPAFTPAARSAATPGEWRSGRLYYAEAPLAEIVADLQRYSATPIRIEDPAIGAIRVTTSFRTGEIPAFLANLETTLPVATRRADDGAILLAAR